MQYLQHYSCENCGLRSSVQFDADARVGIIMITIHEDHKNKSPKCAIEYVGLQILDIEPLKEAPCQK